MTSKGAVLNRSKSAARLSNLVERPDEKQLWKPWNKAPKFKKWLKLEYLKTKKLGPKS